jgi:hypothetical protein
VLDDGVLPGVVASRKVPSYLPSEVCCVLPSICKADSPTDVSLPAPLLVAPPSNELTMHRLLYRTLPTGRKGQHSTLASPDVESVLIVEAVLDDNVATDSGRFEIILNPTPGSRTICRYGHEASVDIFLPDR